MKKTVIDAADVTRTVLMRVDGWYDAYWFSECPTSRPERVNDFDTSGVVI